MNKLLKAFPYIFYTLFVMFIIIYIKNIDYSKLASVRLDWAVLFISAMLALTARYWQVIIWLAILAGLGAKDLIKNHTSLSYAFAKSWLGRYIPGTAPWIIGKIYFASKYGVSKQKLAISSLIEASLQIITTAIIALILLFFDRRLEIVDKNYIALGALVLVICIEPHIFNKLVSTISGLLKKSDYKQLDKINYRTITKGFALYSILAIINGLSFFFIIKAIYPNINFSDIYFIIGTNCLASASGMLVIFAPSGIGVRETVQLILLSQIMPAGTALIVTVSARALEVIIDLIFFLITRSFQRNSLLDRNALN